MATRVVPVVSLPNSEAAILDYLVKRTALTVGRRVDRADTVVVGRVTAVQHADQDVTHLAVEQVLVGSAASDEIELVSVAATGAGFAPVFEPGERGLVFLTRAAPPGFQLAPGETGMQRFQETGFDPRGQPVSRDATSEVEATIAAVEWYVALHDAAAGLVAAIDSPNPRIARHAIRALALEAGERLVEPFAERADVAAEDLRLRFVLGLHILGAHAAAVERLVRLFDEHGRDAWLRGWDLEATVTEPGQTPDTLFGPDPTVVGGD